MSSDVMHTLQEDKQELQKQLGCMNGFFQLFDRRYLLGQRRHSHHHKKLPQGQSNISKEFKNASEKPKEKNPNNIVKEKHRVSVESSRNSFSSSCSSLDCSKRVQTESSSFCPSIVSEPSSPTSNKKPDLLVPSADIRNVVKDSMTRKPRVVPVKTVAKDGRKGPTMTHVDSPRPLLQHPKPVPYERKDQNLAKLQEISISTSRGVKEVKVTSRYSYDGRESPYKLKSISNIKEHPRLSLDSKQSSMKIRTNVVDQSQIHESGSNKQPPSSVVAKLMGLEVLKCESLKIKPCLDDESTSGSRLSRTSVSPRVSNVLTRIPLEPAPWKHEVKQPVNKKARDDCQSVYGQIEKRLTEVEFKTSGKDLRALKQILEAIQRTKMRLENTGPHKSVIKPANVTSDPMVVITNLQKVKKPNPGRGRARNIKPTEAKATGKAKKLVSSSHETVCLNRENHCNSRNTGTVSPRLKKSKIKKQSNGKLNVSNSKTRDQSCNDSCNTRRKGEQGDTTSFPSESDASVASQNEPEVMSSDWSRENKNKFAERLMGYKTIAEQPSPVSILDAFYTEDIPSPIEKKSYAFKDDEDLCFNEREWNQVGIDNLESSTGLNKLSSGFSNTKFENIKQLVHQIELLDSTNDDATINPHEDINKDHIYIKEILLASGFLKNVDCATTIVHLHPTDSLINPELFNILEKRKVCTSKSNKIKRKMIFDTINNILAQKLAMSASSGLWTNKTKGGILNGEKLLEELCLEINNLQTNKVSDPYDQIISIISEDVNKKSEDWDNNCNEIPALVLDIERLIFKDLISEIVKDEISDPQERHGRHRRQLFLM